MQKLRKRYWNSLVRNGIFKVSIGNGERDLHVLGFSEGTVVIIIPPKYYCITHHIAHYFCIRCDIYLLQSMI